MAFPLLDASFEEEILRSIDVNSVAIVDKLRNADFVYPNEQFNYLLLYAIKKECSTEIIDQLFALACIKTSSDFLQRASHLLMLNQRLLDWAVKKWCSANSNEHSELMSKLLENPHMGFSKLIVLALHPDIHQIEDPHSIGKTKQLHFEIAECLLKVDIAYSKVISDVISVLGTKLDWFLIVTATSKIFTENFNDREMFDRITSPERLRAMEIGAMLAVGICHIWAMNEDWSVANQRNQAISEAIIKVIMPFSAEISADAHLAVLRSRLNEVRSIAVTLVKTATFLNSFNPPRSVERDQLILSNVDGELQRLENNDGLVEFCVEGKYAAKSSLQALCRAEIRKNLLQSANTENRYVHLVKSVQALELPKRIERFLMFDNSFSGMTS